MKASVQTLVYAQLLRKDVFDLLRLALVGAGGIGQRHAEALAKIPEVCLTAVIDVDHKKAHALADQYGGRVYTTLRDCLTEVDVVSILTPPSTHKELAVEAMEAGKHVLCEKPIAIRLEDAQVMVETAKRCNVKLMTAFNMRFRKGFKKLKEAVESGEIGKVINFWSQRLGKGAGNTGWSGYNWRTDPQMLCGMSIESLSHDIDLLRWICGDLKDIRANIFKSIPELPDFDDNANVVCTLKNGGTALIHASWTSMIGRNSRGIIGTKGTIIAEGSGLWEIERVRLRTLDMEDELIEIIEKDTLDVTSYYEENRYFIDCVLHDRALSVTGLDGLKALEISHAILESSQKGAVVSVNA